MPPETFQQPLYLLPQDKKRALIPRTLLLLVLGVIFYLGVLLNIRLLNLRASDETVVKIIALVFILVLIILGIFLSYRHAKIPFTFYKDKIIGFKKEFAYTAITKVEKKQNILDKLFKTYSLDLGIGKLEYISDNTDVENYLHQLVYYAKRNSGLI